MAQTAEQSGTSQHRLRIQAHGAVQGVGFRPFVYRLAIELGLRGWVNNSSQGLCIEVEGNRSPVESFLLRLERERPPHAFIQSLESTWLDPAGYAGFEIRESETGEKTALVLPDIATCSACLSDIFDPNNRRYRYPFTNCTHCGPRYSIIEAVPYDRANTSMKGFAMCPDCLAEYQNPENRRFHAQPNACPKCGPHLEFWDASGQYLATHDEALRAGAQAIRDGKILALKGLGGFQFLVDARHEAAVMTLRERKHREEKPFAVMFPTLDSIRAVCEVTALEERLLCSSEAPIVLLRRLQSGHADSQSIPNQDIAPSVAPENPMLGAMLPYTPLHHLIMADLGFPIVATSGNLSDEPICIDEQEVVERLKGIADVFLVHNRPIVRQVDDSVARIMAGREMVMRRARGYAPLPIHARKKLPVILGVGGHLKNTVAISRGQDVFVSQHLGDLETEAACQAFTRGIEGLRSLFDLAPEAVACDAHPDYRSTAYAQTCGLPVIPVQHHHAHVASCMAENDLEPPALGISWDGTGYGLDGTVWGGEFLSVTGLSFRRVATFRSFPLPGGDQAIKEPRRIALGLLYAMFGPEVAEFRDLAPIRAFKREELNVLITMMEKDLNSPQTTSVGRLFDAVAALMNLRQQTRYEGQAAMMVEWAAMGVPQAGAYPVGLNRREPEVGIRDANAAPLALGNPQASIIVDWEPLVWGILEDVRKRVPAGWIAARFHYALVEVMAGVSRLINQERVVLTGGCFQNRYLTERAVERLRREGFKPYWHQRIPPNDGGLALGQVFAAVWQRTPLETKAPETPGRSAAAKEEK